LESNKHIIEEIVRQVGHLPELYEDARSKKNNVARLVSKLVTVVVGRCSFQNVCHKAQSIC
jgi:hypothetical protein